MTATTETTAGRRPGTRPAFASTELQQEIASFLALEAELMDDRRYHEWIELVTEDFVYFVPTPRTPDTPYKPHWDERTMLIDESKWSLYTQWFRRLDEDIYEMAWGENPPVRLRHLVTNIRALVTEDPGRFEVRSNVALVGTRQSDSPKYLTGQRSDTIVHQEGELYLARRWVALDQVVLDFPQLRVML